MEVNYTQDTQNSSQNQRFWGLWGLISLKWAFLLKYDILNATPLTIITCAQFTQIGRYGNKFHVSGLNGFLKSIEGSLEAKFRTLSNEKENNDNMSCHYCHYSRH